MHQTSNIKTAATVGTFDGVHLGHRRVVDFLKEESLARNLQPMVITFDPHPLAVVAPQRAPKLLESAPQRVEMLRSLGVDCLLLPFDDSLRRLTVKEWLSLLRSKYGVELLVVGYDNKFGCDGRNMGVDDYRALAMPARIEVVEAPVVEGICSSNIRRAIAEGDMEKAAAMLGRNYSLEGVVGHGRGDGHRLGFPTANLQVSPNLQLPAPGVYAADAVTNTGIHRRAVVNIGVAPTINDGLPLTIEAHLLDFDADLYGAPLRLEFLRRLRSERRFDSLDGLRNQILADIAMSR